MGAAASTPPLDFRTVFSTRHKSMKTLLKSATLLIAAITMAVVPAAAQEAMTESYFQAALNAMEKSNYAEAARFARLGLSEVEKLRASDPKVVQRQTIRGLNVLSWALIELKNYPEAEKRKREEIELMESVKDKDSYPEYSTNYPMSLESLGFILTQENKYEEAEEVYRRALSFRERIYGAPHKSVATSLINLGSLYLKQGKLSEAEVMSRRALTILSGALENNELKDDDLFLFLRAARNLALIDVERKRYIEAEKTYKFMISAIEKFYGLRDSSLIEPLEEYAKLLRVMKRPIEAARIESRVALLKR
jgi:tetratricopeptide (TPR) repeat protein